MGMSIADLRSRFTSIDEETLLPNGGKSVIRGSQVRFFDRYDRLHRGDGLPAVMSPGRRSYYVNGARHRINGPADVEVIEGGAKRNRWYINGGQINSWGEFHRKSGMSEEDIAMNILDGTWRQDEFQ